VAPTAAQRDENKADQVLFLLLMSLTSRQLLLSLEDISGWNHSAFIFYL